MSSPSAPVTGSRTLRLPAAQRVETTLEPRHRLGVHGSHVLALGRVASQVVEGRTRAAHELQVAEIQSREPPPSEVHAALEGLRQHRAVRIGRARPVAAVEPCRRIDPEQGEDGRHQVDLGRPPVDAAPARQHPVGAQDPGDPERGLLHELGSGCPRRARRGPRRGRPITTTSGSRRLAAFAASSSRPSCASMKAISPS